MNYFIGGINGTGKTTFLSCIEGWCSNFETVRSSARLFEFLGISLGDYETLKTLPAEFKNEQFSQLICRITETVDQTNKNLIVEGHYINFDNGQITDVIGDWLAKFDALILLRSTSDDIWRRVNEDQHRTGRYNLDGFDNPSDRDIKAMIEHYSIKTDAKAKYLAKKYNKPLLKIDNKYGNIDPCVCEFLTFHRSLSMDHQIDEITIIEEHSFFG